MRYLKPIISVIVCLNVGLSCSAASMNGDVVYQIVTDRFFDGDRKNNDVPPSLGMFDGSRKNWQAFWGGDLAGIASKIPYLKKLGVTAIWISPPVDNANALIKDEKGIVTAPYHGFHARDWMTIEEHFGDAANSWKALDRLVKTAHKNKIKVVVDFACNHSNQQSAGDLGALYDNGHLVADINNDPDGLFHHTPPVDNYNDRYQIQYRPIFDLADLNQSNERVDSYLKSAILKFQEHGVDGFRFDAIKHANWGWQYSLLDMSAPSPSVPSAPPLESARSARTRRAPLATNSFRKSARSARTRRASLATASRSHPFMFGEWYEGDSASPLWREAIKFSNQSGMALIDFPLAMAMREAFSGKGGFRKIADVLSNERLIEHPEQMVTFFDNHDLPRLLNLNSDKQSVHLALAFLLTCRGIPCITYGTERYLVNTTNGGADPYNRAMMDGFSTDDHAFKLIGKLAQLRRANPALCYGKMTIVRAYDNAILYEREFEGNHVLVAINKDPSQEMTVVPAHVGLPPGKYTDFLKGELHGVSAIIGEPRPLGMQFLQIPVLNQVTLPPASVSIWIAEKPITKPIICSALPWSVHPGSRLILDGLNFGERSGTVEIGGVKSEIVDWKNDQVVIQIPKIPEGKAGVKIRSNSGLDSNDLCVTAHSGKLIPVTFDLTDLPKQWQSQKFFIAGDTVELGNDKSALDAAGPMMWDGADLHTLTVCLPAGKRISIKLFKSEDGKLEYEPESNRIYTVPAQGVGKLSCKWQVPK